MSKRSIATIILVLILSYLFTNVSVLSATKRVSVLFVHYSVGTTISEGYCWNAQYQRNITETLDTMTVTFGLDTARIVFRSYRMNNDPAGNPLSDTLPGSGNNGCSFDRFNGFRYDFSSSSYNRVRIWNSDNGLTGDAFAGLIDQFFNVPGKEDSLWWKIFTTHDVPSSGPTPTTEINGYDLVIIKNPYACWFQMTQTQADSIRQLYKVVRDSVVAHPEINFAFAMGTPLRLGHEVWDSTQAKITYDLATWFASDSFLVHDNASTYRNVWTWNSYQMMTEQSPDSANRYCLKEEYYAGGGSHLSVAGRSVAQLSLIEFLKGAVRDILVKRSGPYDRLAVDRMMLQYKNGVVPEKDILESIRLYENGY